MDIYFDSGFIQELNKDIYEPQKLLRKGMRRLMDLFEDYDGICAHSALGVCSQNRHGAGDESNGGRE